MAGRRPAVGTPSELDSHAGGGGAATGGGQITTSTASGVGSTTPTPGTASSDAASLFSTGLLQTIDAENLQVMGSILREWRRLPLIVTNQHVKLLQVELVILAVVLQDSILF